MKRSIRSSLMLCSALALGFATPVHADQPGEEEMGTPTPRRRTEAAEPAPRAPKAEAAAVDECPTWFPDFHCDREGRFEGFHMPIVQPYLFEDPFVTTGIYPYYAWHEFPDDSALGGGEVHVAAVQARLALTDRLGFVASKDGYVWLRPDNPLLDDDEGFWDLAFGLKYQFLEMPEEKIAAAAILRIEVPIGSSDVLAGNGSGVAFLPSLSAAWEPIEKLHLIADFGAWVPTDGDDHSSYLFWHAYAAYSVHPHFQPFIQFSGERYLASGDGDLPIRLTGGAELPLDTVQHALGVGHFEGIDVLNLGSRGVDNDQYATFAVGAHIPITEHVTFSAAYEIPITEREMITEQRVTTAIQIEF